ncbi:amidohydrolase family protein [Streptomyces sp. YKOK-I1]
MPVAGIRTGAPAQPADLVLRHAKIFTGDPKRPAATALAVRNGSVTVVGGDRAVAALVGPRTRVIDALGHRVVPGLNDSRHHVVRGGPHVVLELRWDGVRTLRQGLATVREQAARTPPGRWLRVTGGWSVASVAEHRMPTPTELNAAAPDTPVVITHLSQAALLNRAALHAAGITRDSPDPVGGQLVNRFGSTSLIDAADGFQDFPSGYRAVTDLQRRVATAQRREGEPDVGRGGLGELRTALSGTGPVRAGVREGGEPGTAAWTGPKPSPRTPPAVPG